MAGGTSAQIAAPESFTPTRKYCLGSSISRARPMTIRTPSHHGRKFRSPNASNGWRAPTNCLRSSATHRGYRQMTARMPIGADGSCEKLLSGDVLPTNWHAPFRPAEYFRADRNCSINFAELTLCHLDDVGQVTLKGSDDNFIQSLIRQFSADSSPVSQ